MELKQYIKYCLGYLEISQGGFRRKAYKEVELMREEISVIGLLNGDDDGNVEELINLETFYAFLPDDVEDEKKGEYETEKEKASVIDELHNDYENDPFRHELLFNFGFYKVSLPKESDEETEENEEEEKEIELEEQEHPLFSIPVRIIKQDKKGRDHYYVVVKDHDVRINIGPLASILNEDLYNELWAQISEYENQGKLTTPILTDEIFHQIWSKVQSQLVLGEAQFGKDSFIFHKTKLNIGPRSNYFLTEDLRALAELENVETDTAMDAWVSDENLNNKANDIPHESEIFFPLLYNKYQLRTLNLLQNRASIIQGPPGTGKSETIANILCHLAANNKKVLFVSQKPQALKVVKDKLKSLNINYLYAYLPNPSSDQLDDEDEADGIGTKLASLSAYIRKIDEKYKDASISISEITDQRTDQEQKFNQSIDNERKIVELHSQLEKLSEFDLDWKGEKQLLLEIISVEKFKELLALDGDLEQIVQVIENLEKQEFTINTEHLDKLDFHNTYSEYLKRIIEIYQADGYDRKNKIIKKIKDTKFKFDLKDERRALPQEIIDMLDGVIAEMKYKTEKIFSLQEVYDYCLLKEKLIQKENIEKGFRTLQDELRLSEDILSELLRILRKHGEAEAHKKIERVLRLHVEIEKLSEHGSLSSYAEAIKKSQEERQQRVARYIQNRLDKKLQENDNPSMMRNAKRLAAALKKSKKAFKTFDKLRQEPSRFENIASIIPIWLTELDDASRVTPLKANLFDYVILDEASQCNVAYTLPIMYRAKHAVFVGDSKQMRDTTVRFKSNKMFDQLAHKYDISEDMSIKASGSGVLSVLDIADRRGFADEHLRYHYRSPRELIGFSNKYFYKPENQELIVLNNNYLPYKDTGKVMLLHRVAVDENIELSDNTNVSEAKAIVDRFKDIRSDSQTKNKSVGILTFFNHQASLLRSEFEKAGFQEERDNFKVSVIEGIQGDEKDIVLYSFVIKNVDQKRQYIALTGESGDINGPINAGRVNVAFSRARQQVHCFLSIEPEDIPEGIWIKKYINYVLDHGEMPKTDKIVEFDSYFEEEFYANLKQQLGDSVLIANQVESCGFKIDFVVTNKETGQRLAIECDGPCHYANELDEELDIRIESDWERQAILEAAGWEFYRIKYSEWIVKEEKLDFLNDIKSRLFLNIKNE